MTLKLRNISILQGIEEYTVYNTDFPLLFDQRFTLLSDRFIAVDRSNDIVHVSVDCKRLPGPTNSKMYCGLALYDLEKRFISPELVNRVDESVCTVRSVEGKDVTFVEEDVVGWMNNDDRRPGCNCIGIYFAGNTNMIPDKIVQPRNTMAFESVEGNRMRLANEFDEETKDLIVSGITKFMKHSSGGSYNYCTMSSISPPSDDFQTYQGTVQGVSWGIHGNRFRQGTRYMKMLFLVNYQVQPDDDGEYPKVCIRNPKIRIERQNNNNNT